MGGGGGGGNKKSSCIGEPLLNFFSSVLTLSFFFFAKLGGRGCPNLFGWVRIVNIFGDKMSSDNS